MPTVTGRQIKAARALIGLSGERLALETGFSHATIVCAERRNGNYSATLARIVEVLEDHGISFTRGGVELGERRPRAAELARADHVAV